MLIVTRTQISILKLSRFRENKTKSKNTAKQSQNKKKLTFIFNLALVYLLFPMIIV